MKYQLLHLSFLETKSKYSTLCILYRQIYIMNHVSGMSALRFPLCCCKKVASLFTAPEETCNKTQSVISSCTEISFVPQSVICCKNANWIKFDLQKM